MTIPRRIHQMWLDKKEIDNDSMPESHRRSSLYRQYIENLREMNPTFDYQFWNRRKIDDLWNDPRLSRWRQFYDDLPYHIEKCDMARYAILYLNGGIYLDLDFIPLKPFDDELLDREMGLVLEPSEHNLPVLSRPRAVANGVLMSSERHPLWPRLLDTLMKRYSTSKEAVGNTGPHFLGKFLEEEGVPSSWYVDRCLFIPLTSRQELSSTCPADTLSRAYVMTRWNEGTDWQRDYHGWMIGTAMRYAIPIVLGIGLIILLIYLWRRTHG